VEKDFESAEALNTSNLPSDQSLGTWHTCNSSSSVDSFIACDSSNHRASQDCDIAPGVHAVDNMLC